MFKKNLLFASVFLFAGSMSLFAQSKLADTVTLHEVVIAPSKQSFNTGYTTVNLSVMRKKEYAATTLTDVLSDQTGVTVNSYGPLGSATLSIRGTMSNHTAVVWNGINLQSTMLGEADLSLMSCQMFDQVSIQLGGCSALYGSGAIGGAVFLNNSSDVSKGVSISASQYAGSFGTRNSLLSVILGNGIISSSTKLSYFSSANDFTFRNLQKSGSPIDTVRDASQYQWSLLQALNWNVNANNHLSLYAWLLGSQYHIARTMLQTDAPSSEDNHNSRFVALWEQKFSIFSNTTRIALVHDEMQYKKLSLNPWHIPTVATAEYESKADFDPNHSLDLGVQAMFERASSTDYDGIKSRNRLAATGSYKQTSFSNQLELGVNARGELVDGEASPFTSSVGLQYKPSSYFLLKSNLSKNFRLPTFNDLYWNPGGNINLKPENGWSTDFGFQTQAGDDAFRCRLLATGYSSWVKDMIVWVPVGGTYTPQNFTQVWSRGAELGINTTIQMSKFTLGCDANYTYTRSTQMINGSYTSDQMIYIPENKASVYTYLSYGRTRLSYTHKIESIRYYSQSYGDRKADQIDGYGLGILSLSSSVHISGVTLGYGAKINNLWNASYQVMPWYPMPMRNYMIYLSFEL